jgi:hypothetical protein
VSDDFRGCEFDGSSGIAFQYRWEQKKVKALFLLPKGNQKHPTHEPA